MHREGAGRRTGDLVYPEVCRDPAQATEGLDSSSCCLRWDPHLLFSPAQCGHPFGAATQKSLWLSTGRAQADI